MDAGAESSHLSHAQHQLPDAENPSNNRQDATTQGAHGVPQRSPSEALAEKMQSETQATVNEAFLATVPFPDHPYIVALRDGYKALLSKVLDEETAAGHALTPAQQQTFLDAGCDVLASTHRDVLVGVIAGTLAASRFSPTRPDGRRVVARADTDWEVPLSSGRYQPAVYAQYLVDARGRPPTPEDLALIIGRVRAYASRGGTEEEWTAARRIDTAVGLAPRKRDWRRGERRYLGTAAAFERAQRFCAAVARRNAGSTRPLGDFGYTENARERFGEQRSHGDGDGDGANYLLSLVDAVARTWCTTRTPTRSGRGFTAHPTYHVEQLVVYRVWDPAHAWVAELLFTRLGGGPIDTGCGFVHEPAGRGVYGSGGLASEYAEWRVDAMRRTAYRANLEEQKKLLQKRRAEAAAPDAQELAALQAAVAALSGQIEQAMRKAERGGADARTWGLPRYCAVWREYIDNVSEMIAIYNRPE